MHAVISGVLDKVHAYTIMIWLLVDKWNSLRESIHVWNLHL